MAVSEQVLVTGQQLDTLCINTIRTLAIDAVQQANSGHPGAPMGLAPVAYALWEKFLRYDPADPTWLNRDRFVLSNGHASMLLYALLYLAEVRQVDDQGHVTNELAVTMDQIKHFRQLGSRTPGHPESHITSGVETTTGPLGQGVGNSVGMAIASRWLAATFNRPGYEIFDWNVYTMCSDGDLMEGIGGEAASLAGHLKLSNLCWMYDHNSITLDGPASWSFSEDVATRFIGYGWNVTRVADANDLEMISRAYEVFKKETDRPTLIIVDSHIGYGSPHKQDTNAAHGEPLGEDEVKLVKKFYGWPEDAKFLVPDGVREHFQEVVGKRGADLRGKWSKTFNEYSQRFPELAEQLRKIQHHDLPAGWDKDLPTFPADAKGVATRESSGKVLNAVAKNIPWMIGGSADLATSNKTTLKFEEADGDFSACNYRGRNLHFGVREHVMGAAVNGMTISGLRAFGATFFNFSDYMKASIRLAALGQLPAVFIYTHDSIGVGEDGPTHQPVEQLAGLRAMPNLLVLRPGDANEVTECWKIIAKQQHTPVALVLTRQNLPTLDRTKYAAASGVAKGGYVLADSQGKPDVIFIATGSEVSLCVDAYEKLKSEGVKARVVSLPCWKIFDNQDQSYKDSVLPPDVTARVSVEMAATFGWERYTGSKGKNIGMHRFGASAPLKDLLKYFGFTVDKVVEAARAALAAK